MSDLAVRPKKFRILRLNKSILEVRKECGVSQLGGTFCGCFLQRPPGFQLSLEKELREFMG